LLLLLLPVRRCLLQSRGSKVHRTENLTLDVVDLWNANAKLRRVKILLMFHRYGVCWLCGQVERLGRAWKVQSVRSFAPPCYCVGVNRFAIKSLLNTRCCKFRYIYDSLPGNWLVKTLYLVQSVARTV
jgi:hypothetical protein